jgi:hypothetical protein
VNVLVRVKQEQASNDEPIARRLDALIRLFIEVNKPDAKKEFTEGAAARILQSVRLTPTEIARVLGKKSATDVSKYLYSKKNRG